MKAEKDYLLEIYKIGFERLQFQDDYIFKFSALFITFNGALGYVWKDIYLANLADRNNHHDFFMYLIALFGLFICFIWFMWMRHNDYWHSIWVGCLKNIEMQICRSSLFSANGEEIAKAGDRKKPCLKGHDIASLLPILTAIVWFSILIFIFKCQ